MNKRLHTAAKVLLTLIIVNPIFGALGIYPAPTRELYTSDEAYEFIRVLLESGYVMPIMSLCFLAILILLWTRREAFAALLLLPFTVNIVLFHMILDGGLFTPGAIMGNVLLVLNAYLLWNARAQYAQLLTPQKNK